MSQEMTSKEMDLYHPMEWVDMSGISTYTRCPRKWFYEYGCRLKEPEHIALTYGTAIHAGLAWSIRGDIDGAMKMFMNVWKDLDREDDTKRN